jgi:type I restriction enzyme, S subunit
MVDTAFGIIPNSEILHYQYLFHFCRQFDFNRLNRAAVLPSLTKGDLMKIQMKIPPLELQNHFADFVQQTDKSKFKIQKLLDESQLLFDSLMQKNFFDN